ncbi:hypothetical protein [Thalassotalea mangrovi]|uniref:Prenyltransferase n=1 Tax=Thalassotalea mangrovi TaxID=2572245 RepID=A0A4U1B4Q6_9GAMM|nr:hypothetical protein [Thalassotalea mangrovi]TKB45353.1 hypothetical protein E8M12_09140 [Thalassotalea mangrovi]
MSLYLQLLLGAIRPRSLFLPCSAIILGSGLAAFEGYVDGALFASLLFVTMFAQIIVNLAGDYQRAFIIHARNSEQSGQANKHQQLQASMLKLILGLFVLFCIAIGSLTLTSTGVAPVSLTLLILCCLLLLSVLRHKTRRGLPTDRFGQILSLLVMALLSASLPFLLSHYLYTASLQSIDLLIAIAAGCLALMTWFSEQIMLRFATQNVSQIDADATPLVQSQPAINNLLNAQMISLIVAVLLTLTLIIIAQLPILTFAFIFAIPSLAATIITTRHLPDFDTAQSQLTKTGIASFSYWVLFVIGLMW